MIWPLLFIAISASASTFRISREVLSDRAEVIFHTSDKGIVRERNSNVFGKPDDQSYGRSFIQTGSGIRKISNEIATISSVLKKSDSLLRSFGEEGMTSLADPGSRTMKIEIDGIALIPGSKNYVRALAIANDLLGKNWKLADGQMVMASPYSIKTVKNGNVSTEIKFDPHHYCSRQSAATVCKFSGTGPVYLE